MRTRENMKRFQFQILRIFSLSVLVVFFITGALSAQQKKPVTFEDYAQWKTLSQQKIADNGKWLIYKLSPNKGNPEIVLKNLTSGNENRYQKGTNPQIAGNSVFAAFTRIPEDSLDEKTKKKQKNGLVCIRLADGSVTEIDSVKTYRFSEDGNWLVYTRFSPEKKKDKAKENKGKKKEKKTGDPLFLVNLTDMNIKEISFVTGFTMDKDSKFLVYAVSADKDEDDGLFAAELKKNGNTRELLKGKGEYNRFSWSEKKNMLAFVSSRNDQDSEIPAYDLYVWNTKENNAAIIVDSKKMNLQDNMIVSKNGSISWSEDDKVLFFGRAPKEEKELSKKEKEKLPGVDVWHWKDVELQPRQKIEANREKNRTYVTAYHFDSGTVVPVGNREFEQIRASSDGTMAIGYSQKKYFTSIPWRYPNFRDVYLIDTKDGSKKLVLEETLNGASWSPEGKYILYYDRKNWWLYTVKTGTKRNLTGKMDVLFWNVDDDHPDVKRAYGGGYWLKNNKYFLLYDKYDIWKFSVKEDEKPVNITGGTGRAEEGRFRYVRLDREEKSIETKKPVYLSYFNMKTKQGGYCQLNLESGKLTTLIKDDKRFSSLSKAKNADMMILRIETFDEYPNVYTADMSLDNLKRVTDANPQQKDYAWGHNELFTYLNTDGVELSGALTYPANYEKGKKYPLVVYIYEKLSDVLHTHYIPLANHRFNASVFASNGYAVLKPDIIYKIGHPGPSSVNCVVPAVQKLIDMGIADPERIGLQGHSWGGYETAYIITQTDIFTAAITGAPVSNMTSAYGGIRWGSGLSRQFQYERTQSRLGGSLWEYPERYIENSPQFFLDRVNTPLLILHGDKDDAVPWYQGIELFVGLWRLGKDVIMLQYNDEPHHLSKEKNKDDFTRKMWEYFEHYLHGKPAPEWIKNGVPYLKKGTK